MIIVLHDRSPFGGKKKLKKGKFLLSASHRRFVCFKSQHPKKFCTLTLDPGGAFHSHAVPPAPSPCQPQAADRSARRGERFPALTRGRSRQPPARRLPARTEERRSGPARPPPASRLQGAADCAARGPQLPQARPGARRGPVGPGRGLLPLRRGGAGLPGGSPAARRRRP